MNGPCQVCIYQNDIPGDAYKRCIHPNTARGPGDRLNSLLWNRSNLFAIDLGLVNILGVEIDMQGGGEDGWCNWPDNYDPIWILDCQAGRVFNPVGVQWKRLKGWKKPALTTMVTRGTAWGNPFIVGELVKICIECKGKTLWFGGQNLEFDGVIVKDLAHSLKLFEAYARLRSLVDLDWLRPLKGKNLGCYCALDEPCHREILLRLAN
jgi:hypothetical protein